MNIFQSLKLYGKWQVKESRNLNSEEKALILSAVVVSSEYGNSVQFSMVGGGLTFIPLSETSTLGVGEKVALEKIKLLTLTKQGEPEIHRIEA